MSGRTVAVAIDTAEPGRVAEALRAAVGLTLRGDRVELIALRSFDAREPRAARALATLRALGHRVDAPPAALAEADAVEIWT